MEKESTNRERPGLERLRTFPQRLACAGLAWTLGSALQSLDLKIAYYDPTVDPARPEYAEHCIFAFWHENLAVLLPRYPNSPVTLLISQHRDASWLKYAAAYLGFNVVRGSTTRGGAEAIRQLRRLRETTSFAITPDGPQGPRQEMALGPLFLASRLKMPLVPVGVGYDRPWRLNTWDRFAVPKPFSRARIVFGPKIRLSAKAGRDELEASRRDVQSLLSEINGFAGVWAETGARVMEELPFVRARRTRSLTFDQADTEPRLTRKPDTMTPLEAVLAGKAA